MNVSGAIPRQNQLGPIVWSLLSEMVVHSLLFSLTCIWAESGAGAEARCSQRDRCLYLLLRDPGSIAGDPRLADW